MQEPMNPPRTRHSSASKWLANELAAIEGSLSRIEAEMARLQTERDKLQAARNALKAVTFSVIEAPQCEPVRPHHLFGERGQFIDWLRRMIAASAPHAVSTVQIAEAAQQAFGLVLIGKARKRFIDNSLRYALHRLAKRGEIEPCRDPGLRKTRAGLWRWKSELTLAHLEKLRDT